jgi:hypothetical protein
MEKTERQKKIERKVFDLRFSFLKLQTKRGEMMTLEMATECALECVGYITEGLREVNAPNDIISDWLEISLVLYNEKFKSNEI